MYVKQITLENYGPIDRLDMRFPFDENTPTPVILVGENGSGKSIVLSHIVDALLTAKGIVYPGTPEVDPNRVYRLRSDMYIRTDREYYFARVAFECEPPVIDIRLRHTKRDYERPPIPEGTSAYDAWTDIPDDDHEQYASFQITHKKTLGDLFSTNCVLYFPHNRFEEPAWLNEDNLRSKAQYMHPTLLQDQTNRQVVSYSPLDVNQDWLFDLLYDTHVLLTKTQQQQVFVRDAKGALRPTVLDVVVERTGRATRFYAVALNVLQEILGRSTARVRFGVGRRRNRRVAVMSADSSTALVPNIFQLSSGEGALLNLFLSILRDFDLSGAAFVDAKDLRGIVVVDEVDLHLHTVHQKRVLPRLIKMFPNVQFVMTTHSPLFALGMSQLFTRDGVRIYELPKGRKVDAEEFGEFGRAYRAFRETQKFAKDVQRMIGQTKKVAIFLDGPTDVDYLRAAAERLDREAVIENCEIHGAGGDKKLRNIWNTPGIADVITDKWILVHDCDSQMGSERKGPMYRFGIMAQSPDKNPIARGIENLFEKETVKKVRECIKKVTKEEWVEGKRVVQEIVAVKNSEKRKMCDWLCKYGTKEDFRHFETMLDIIEAILDQEDAPGGMEFPEIGDEGQRHRPQDNA